MAKLWKLKPQIPQALERNFSAYPKLLAQLLFNRGLTNENQITDFLNPKYENLHSPFLFKDMEKAVDRIWKAIHQKEKICIYGDYDADAVTANAVLQQAFRYLGVEADSYVPDRFSEGYGVNLDAISKIKDSGVKVIITVDCGTNSGDAADFCAQNGMDFIVTDHHEIIGDPPKAYALINPKNRKDTYPYENITGVAVAFKLATALLKDPRAKAQVPNYVDGFEKWLLDLVATGTVADCHSLIGENRILVKYGLKVLQKTRWQGLRALIKLAELDFNQKPPDTYTLGFVIAPRLNAAGRLEHANVALHLLMAENPVEAMEKAARLEEVNQRRQQLTKTILSEAQEKVLAIQDRKVLALVGEGWPKGVMGLVAGRLAEEYYKPVIVLEQTELICTGSARTAGEFNLIEALKFSSEHLLKFGGHKQAAGLSLERSKFELFYQKILEHADSMIDEKSTERILELEAELAEEDFQFSIFNLITQLEPFGVDNTKPKFLVSNVKILSSRPVGATGQHTQYQLQKGNRQIAAIAFNSAFFEKNFKVGDTVDVAAELIEDNWNGNSNIKLKIADLKITQ
jgi:single-stranded-DNA-specific exonuclease